ncbi:hypothetical protein [Legionella sp. CNM-4043-24]|uniref:hypothetical protein n=1 Tax=Legionella sp. CNM-4043-24 TaxID=3421646 RepID=UPI00403AF546
MKHTITAVSMCFLLASPFAANAFDDPSVDEGSSQYGSEMCVEQNTDDCIDAVCLTSSATDCQEQCQSAAEDKCRQLEDE